MISNTILKDKELSMNSFLNFPQREDYDFEELERKLVTYPNVL